MEIVEENHRNRFFFFLWWHYWSIWFKWMEHRKKMEETFLLGFENGNFPLMTQLVQDSPRTRDFDPWSLPYFLSSRWKGFSISKILKHSTPNWWLPLRIQLICVPMFLGSGDEARREGSGASRAAKKTKSCGDAKVLNKKRNYGLLKKKRKRRGATGSMFCRTENT